LFQTIKILVQKACYGRLAIDIDDSKCIARHGYSIRMGSASRPLSHCAVDKSREGRADQYIRQKSKQCLSVEEAGKTGERWMGLSRGGGLNDRENRRLVVGSGGRSGCVCDAIRAGMWEKSGRGDGGSEVMFWVLVAVKIQKARKRRAHYHMVGMSREERYVRKGEAASMGKSGKVATSQRRVNGVELEAYREVCPGCFFPTRRRQATARVRLSNLAYAMTPV
jgi:hypothetical protein